MRVTRRREKAKAAKETKLPVQSYRNYLQEKIVDMAKSFEESKIRQKMVQLSKGENLALKQEFFSLKIKQKDVSKLFLKTQKQVEAIEVHKMIVRTDWAMFLKMVLVLDMIFEEFKAICSRRAIEHRKRSLMILVTFMVARNLNKIRKKGYRVADLERSNRCLSIAATMFKPKVLERSKEIAGNLFNRIYKILRPKHRFLRFSLSGKI